MGIRHVATREDPGDAVCGVLVDQLALQGAADDELRRRRSAMHFQQASVHHSSKRGLP